MLILFRSWKQTANSGYGLKDLTWMPCSFSGPVLMLLWYPHLISTDVLFEFPAGKCQCLVWKLFSATVFLWAWGAPNLDLPLTRPLAMVISATQTVEWWVPYNSCLPKTVSRQHLKLQGALPKRTFNTDVCITAHVESKSDYYEDPFWPYNQSKTDIQSSVLLTQTDQTSEYENGSLLIINMIFSV